MSSPLEKFSRFMEGRYGFDRLNCFLCFLNVIINVVGVILRFTPFIIPNLLCSLLGTIISIWFIFRVLSRNIYNRTLENERFNRICERLYPKIKEQKEKNADRDYIYRTCPYCKTKLRLKRIRGNHTTRCPKCSTTFKVRVLFGRKN